MTKTKLLILVLILLALPFSTQAFSWRNLVFWDKPKVATPIEKLNSFDATQQKAALAKAALWQEAFNQKNWNKLIKDRNNFQISDTELNFLIKDAINKDTHSPAESVYATFKDNKINVEGQLMTPVKGKFEMIAKISSDGKTLKPIIERIKFKGMRIPKGYANRFLEEYFPDISTFLYTYPNYKTIDVTINDSLLKLNYR